MSAVTTPSVDDVREIAGMRAQVAAIRAGRLPAGKL
jgi:hypothetical protein